MNQKGVSVTFVAYTIVILAFLGVIFVSLLTIGFEESFVEYDSTRALYIAEGGAEAAIGRLKQEPPATYWFWNDGYGNPSKALGDGTVDVEVLHYETRNYSAGPIPACGPFVSSIEPVAANTNAARTIYVILTWNPSDNPNTLDLKLYSDGTCTTEITNASKTVLSNAIFIRYRIPNAAPADVDNSVKVFNNTVGAPYKLSISHPDDNKTGSTYKFTSSSWRSLISLGKVNNAMREVFIAFRRP